MICVYRYIKFMQQCNFIYTNDIFSFLLLYIHIYKTNNDMSNLYTENDIYTFFVYKQIQTFMCANIHKDIFDIHQFGFKGFNRINLYICVCVC